jgi:hypothetical protein
LIIFFTKENIFKSRRSKYKQKKRPNRYEEATNLDLASKI